MTQKFVAAMSDQFKPGSIVAPFGGHPSDLKEVVERVNLKGALGPFSTGKVERYGTCTVIGLAEDLITPRFVIKPASEVPVGTNNAWFGGNPGAAKTSAQISLDRLNKGEPVSLIWTDNAHTDGLAIIDTLSQSTFTGVLPLAARKSAEVPKYLAAYEKAMREDAIRVDTHGRKCVPGVLSPAQFAIAQEEFSRQVKNKVADAKRAEAEADRAQVSVQPEFEEWE